MASIGRKRLPLRGAMLERRERERSSSGNNLKRGQCEWHRPRASTVFFCGVSAGSDCPAARRFYKASDATGKPPRTYRQNPYEATKVRNHEEEIVCDV